MDVKLEVESVLANWNIVETFIKENINRYILDNYLMHKIILSCEEIFVNICSYAYKNKVGSICLEIYVGDRLIKFTFSDEGIEFNPVKFETKSIVDRIKNGNFGGVGILLVKKNMDVVEYKRIGNKNILTMTKNLGSDNIEQ